MKKILITGCSGFLGTYLSGVLKENNNNVLYGITEVSGYKADNMDVFTVDIREREEVFRVVEEVKPDFTFHLAAISNVGFSWRNQKLTYEVNFIGSSNLVEALSFFSPGSRIILMSTAEISDKISPYSLSKAAMEMMGDLYINSKNMDIIKIRSFNFTGPGQDRQFVASDFAFQISEIEKGNKKPVIEVGNLSAVRDFSDVRDISRYLRTISYMGDRGDTYLLCSGKSFSIKEILDILLSLSEKKIKVVVDKNKFRPVDAPVLEGDNSVLKNKFNLKPRYDMKQTLLDLLNYWRSSS